MHVALIFQMETWSWARTGLFKLGPKKCSFGEILIKMTGEEEFCDHMAFTKKSTGSFIAELLRAFHTLTGVGNH